MADIFSKAKRSEVMAAIKATGNQTTEKALASAFRCLGVKGWRRHVDLLGKPDFVFREQQLAVFVDGCFWHSCPKHGHVPHSNTTYWRKKLARNRTRDAKVKRELARRGWRVLRIWEHSVKASPTACANRVARALLKGCASAIPATRSTNRGQARRKAGHATDDANHLG